MRRAAGTCAVSAVATLALAAIPASAGQGDAPTREEWAAAADAVCKPLGRENAPRFRKAMRLAENGRRLKRAGTIVQSVFRNSREGIRAIARLERPTGDEQAIQAWVDGEFRALGLAIRAGAVLADGHVDRFGRLFERATRFDRQAQRNVRGFGLRHCTS